MPQDVVAPRPPVPSDDAPGAWTRLCSRYFVPAAAVVLVLAALNVGARLDREIVTDWDEALYAITAWESLQSGDWIGTTFFGKLDYYNSKPPLNIWLIGFSFKTFGPGLLALRLASAISAWATVLVLMVWARRRFGADVALLAGLILSTSFGFMYVHSGRSGNADALFTLLILLLVIVLCAERTHPWRRVWLGPIAASLFLLKGMAVMMPLVMIAAVLAVRPLRAARWPSFVALLLFVVPSGAWAAARWSVDGIAFFDSMVRNDLFRISTEVLDGHDGSVFYYLNVLQKNHYEWLIAGAAALVLVPGIRTRISGLASRPVSDNALILVVWAAICLLIPTGMRTKLPWYLNPFYPVFALAIGWILAKGLAQYDRGARLRSGLVLATTLAAFIAAEAKLAWYSYAFRDMERSVQGLLMAESGRVAQNRIFSQDWSNADVFVLQAIVRADGGLASGVDDFLHKSQPGDFFVGSPGLEHPSLMHVRSIGPHALYERTRSAVDDGPIPTAG